MRWAKLTADQGDYERYSNNWTHRIYMDFQGNKNVQTSIRRGEESSCSHVFNYVCINFWKAICLPLIDLAVRGACLSIIQHIPKCAPVKRMKWNYDYNMIWSPKSNCTFVVIACYQPWPHHFLITSSTSAANKEILIVASYFRYTVNRTKKKLNQSKNIWQ